MLLIVLSFNIMSSVVLPQYTVLIARDSFLFVALVITVPCDCTPLCSFAVFTSVSEASTLLISGLVSHFLLHTCGCLC